MLDLIVDPVALPQPTFLYGADQLRRELRSLVPNAVGRGSRDWSRGATYDGMLAPIREIREQNTNCFPYRNYTQLPLAFAFLTAKTRKMASAERELEEYLAGDWLKEAAAARLRRLPRETVGAV